MDVVPGDVTSLKAVAVIALHLLDEDLSQVDIPLLAGEPSEGRSGGDVAAVCARAISALIREAISLDLPRTKPLRTEHLLQALRDTRPSVSEEYAKQCREW